MKSDVFKIELGYIVTEKIAASCKTMINLLPDYFFEVGASSTGKYHPAYAQGKGGLLRHTKAAVRIAVELLNDPAIGDKYSREEKDLMIMALILHDGLKHGLEQSKYVLFEHPLLISKYIYDNKEKLELTDEEISFVRSVIETHMGPWTTDYQGNEVLQKPKTKYQNFVHLCDFLASKKFLLVPFDENNNINV